MAISDNIMKWKNIRGEFNKLAEEVKEQGEDISALETRVGDDETELGSVKQTATQAKNKADANEDLIEGIETKLELGARRMIQKNFTIRTTDWHLGSVATLHDDVRLKSEYDIQVSPAVEENSTQNVRAIAAAQIVPLEITNEGYLTLICQNTPEIDVVITITCYIPISFDTNE